MSSRLKPSEMKFDDLAEEYQAGVDDYFAGRVPDGWNAKDANQSPYLAGWNHAADAENGQNWFAGDDEDDEEE